MSDEWDDLARLAKAATPGPWDWRDEQYPGQLVHRMEVGGWPVHPLNVLKCKDDWPPSPADAEFIAAANPTTILRLIAENRDLSERLAQAYRDEVLAHDERDALAARLAAVEALAKGWAVMAAQAMDDDTREWLTAASRSVLAALAAPTDTTKETP